MKRLLKAIGIMTLVYVAGGAIYVAGNILARLAEQNHVIVVVTMLTFLFCSTVVTIARLLDD